MSGPDFGFDLHKVDLVRRNGGRTWEITPLSDLAKGKTKEQCRNRLEI